MAFTFIATAEYNLNISNSATCDKPTGTVDNDIMFALVEHYSDFANSVPSGWTSLGQNTTAGGQTQELFWKLASSEGANYTWGTANSARFRVIIATYRGGFDTTDPIDQFSNTAYSDGGANAPLIRAASVNATSANSPCIHWGIIVRALDTSFTPPTSPVTFNEDFDSWNTLPDFANCISSAVLTSSGATGDVDAVASVGVSNTKHAFMVVLNPSGSTPSANTGFFAFM